MSDSITILFQAAGLTREQMAEEEIPFNVRTSSNQHGEIHGRHPEAWYAKSPLTGAGYKVTPVFDEDIDKPILVTAYLVEINLPACTVRNNVLIQNLVWTACKFAKLFLQYVLLTQGCSSRGVQRISLDAATIQKVTLTYLFPCDTHADALVLNDQFYYHADAVLNEHLTKGKGKKVFRVGNGSDSTVYCKHRDHEISSYVKSGKTTKAFDSIDSQNAAAIYAVGSTFLRVESTLNKNYLKTSVLEKPSAWKTTKDGANPHSVGIVLVREQLRLDDKLRAVLPKPSYIQNLSKNDQDVLNWHLQGKDARQHPLISGSQQARTQFSLAKNRIFKTLRIDISIPWAIQSKQVSQQLANVLQFNGQYRPPQHLDQFCFCLKTLKPLLQQLEAMVIRASPVPVQTPTPLFRTQSPTLTPQAAAAVTNRMRNIMKSRTAKRKTSKP